MRKHFNQYYITERISSKPLRSVYLAHHVKDVSHKVLLKVFDATCLALGQESGRLLHQVEWIKQLRHTHIVPILDLGVEQGQPYIVSQYLPGGSLRQYLDSISPQCLSLQEALKIISQLGQALSYFHEHAQLHENVKPENVFLNEKGEVLLADFRLAGFLDVTVLSYQSDPRTMCYMAPEQFAGSAGQQSDQYALACLVYELIAGRTPFSAQSYAMMWASHYAQAPVPLSNFVPDVPEQIEKALCKAMAKDPSERYADISTFLLALEDAAFSPPWPISKPLALSTLDSSSASLEVPLENVVSNAPVEPTVASFPYEEQQEDISYEGTLASAPFGANLSDVSFSMSLMGNSYGISMVGVPYGTSLTGNPFEKGITGAVKMIQSDAPEKNLEEIQFETGLPADNAFETGTGNSLVMNLTSDAPEKNLEEIQFETGLPADNAFETGTGNSLVMNLTSDAPEKNLEEIQFETGLPADNAFETGTGNSLVMNLTSDASEKNLEQMRFDTRLPKNPFEKDLTEISFEDIQKDYSSENSQSLQSSWTVVRLLCMAIFPEIPLGRDLFEKILPRWLGRLRDYLRSCLQRFAKVLIPQNKGTHWGYKGSVFLTTAISTVQVISRRGLLLLSKQGMHLLEHWKRIVSRLCANKARVTEASILWLVLVSTVFVLIGGVVSDIWLASHSSGVIQSSNVRKAATKTKNIMPIDIKLIARPVADPTVMSTPQGSISSSPSAFVVQPSPTPHSSNYADKILQQIAKFQHAGGF